MIHRDADVVVGTCIHYVLEDPLRSCRGRKLRYPLRSVLEGSKEWR